MNKKLYSIVFALILLVSLVSASKVGYIYRSESKIDSRVVGVFSQIGLEVDFINENSLSNLSKYDFIYVGDESFTKAIPIGDYNAIVSNYYLGQKSGITDSDGISKLVSKHNLNVNVDGKLLPVYTDFVDNRGMAISYYYLGDNNKVSGFRQYAGTDTTSSGNPFGDVISFGEKGLTLSNGKISKGYICFFGIVDSQYWTEEAKDLLKQCITFANRPLGNGPVLNESNGTETNVTESNQTICSKSSDCGTSVFIGNPSCSSNSVVQDFINFTCINSGTKTSYCTNKTYPAFVKSCGLCFSGVCQNVSCFNNSDCNDGNISTQDVCSNSGTINSVCFHNLPGKVQINSFVATPFETSVLLNFSASSPANGSTIKGYFVSINKNDWLWTSANNYTFSGLSASTTYAFYVKAENDLNQTSDEINISITTLAIVVPPVSYSGGGGGAGNGLCITQWNCSSWTECKNSKQTRVCSYPSNYCNATAPKPIEKQSCVDINRTSDLAVDSEILEANPGDNKVNDTGLSFITGAVIGAIGGHPLWFILAFLLLILGIYYYWKFRK